MPSTVGIRTCGLSLYTKLPQTHNLTCCPGKPMLMLSQYVLPFHPLLQHSFYGLHCNFIYQGGCSYWFEIWNHFYCNFVCTSDLYCSAWKSTVVLFHLMHTIYWLPQHVYCPKSKSFHTFYRHTICHLPHSFTSFSAFSCKSATLWLLFTNSTLFSVSYEAWAFLFKKSWFITPFMYLYAFHLFTLSPSGALTTCLLQCMFS